MRFDSLEPLASIWPLQLAAIIAGMIMMAASAIPMQAGKKDWAWIAFPAGVVVFSLGIAAPMVAKMLPADAAVEHNAAAVQSWAESEYGVSIDDGVALRVVRELPTEDSSTDEFPAQGPDGELKVRIEIIDGELQLTAPGEIPKTSD